MSADRTSQDADRTPPRPDQERGLAQRRLLRAIGILSGHELIGLSLAEITTALRADKATVHRDLAVLEAEGWAERLPDTGRWRLGPKPVQIGLAFARHMAAQRARLDETEQRYTREPR